MPGSGNRSTVEELALRSEGLEEPHPVFEDAQIFAEIFNTARESLLVLGADLKILSANRAFYRTFAVRPEETEGRLIYELGDNQWDIPQLRMLLEALLSADSAFTDFEVEHFFGQIGRRTMLLNARRIEASRLILLAIEDITRRREVEVQIKQEKDLAQLYLDVCGVIMVAVNRAGYVTRINQTGCEKLGYAAEEIVGRDWFAHFLPERDRASVRQVFGALLSGDVEAVEHHENAVLTRSGEERHILWHNAVVRNEQGEVVGALGSGTDITERLRAEAALRESEERFRDLFEHSPDAIFVEDLAGRVLDVNPAACRLHNTDRETLIGMNVRDLVPSAQREEALQDFEKLVQGDVRYLIAYRWTVNQRAVPVEIRANRFVYDGKDAILLIVRDVSERIKAEEALEESRARAHAVLETTIDAVVTIDTQGRIESVNPATERIFGYAADELIGQNIKLLMPAPYREEHDQYVQRYLATEEKKIIGIGREVVARRKDGSTFPVDLAVSEVHLDHRRIFTGFIRDVSDRRRLEHEVLRVSEHERQRIGRDLHDGLGSLLTGVAMGAQGMAQALKKGQAIRADELEQLARMVEEGAAQAQALARGLNPVKLEKEGLAAALQELVAQSRTIASVPCTFDYDESLPAFSSIVSAQLYRIAQEAMNNAIKHAHARSLQVRLATREHHVELTVRDDGIGLLPDRRAQAEGTGLYIMPYRANLIGATYSIKGAPGGGTLVSCRMPLEKAAGTAQPG